MSMTGFVPKADEMGIFSMARNKKNTPELFGKQLEARTLASASEVWEPKFWPTGDPTIFDQKGWPKRCTTSGRLPLHIAWIRRGLGELGYYRRTNVWWCRWCKCHSDNHHSVNHLHLFNFNDLKHHWSQFNHRRCLSWHSSVCRGLLSYEGQTWGWVVSTFFTLWHLPRKSRPVWDRVSNLQMFASQTVQDADISWPHC